MMSSALTKSINNADGSSNNSGALTSMPPPTGTVSRKRVRKQTVLPEESFVEALEKIVERDYFPSLKKNNAKLQRVSTTSNRANFDADNEEEDDQEGEDAVDVRHLTVDGFLARYTTEDNAAFEQLQLDDMIARRERYPWLYDQQDGRIPGMLLLYYMNTGDAGGGGGSGSGGRSHKLLTADQRVALDKLLLKCESGGNQHSLSRDIDDSAGDRNGGCDFDTRPAAPQTWSSARFSVRNNFMFSAAGEDNAEVEQQMRERRRERGMEVANEGGREDAAAPGGGKGGDRPSEMQLERIAAEAEGEFLQLLVQSKDSSGTGVGKRRNGSGATSGNNNSSSSSSGQMLLLSSDGDQGRSSGLPRLLTDGADAGGATRSNVTALVTASSSGNGRAPFGDADDSSEPQILSLPGPLLRASLPRSSKVKIIQRNNCRFQDEDDDEEVTGDDEYEDNEGRGGGKEGDDDGSSTMSTREQQLARLLMQQSKMFHMQQQAGGAEAGAQIGENVLQKRHQMQAGAGLGAGSVLFEGPHTPSVMSDDWSESAASSSINAAAHPTARETEQQAAREYHLVSMTPTPMMGSSRPGGFSRASSSSSTSSSAAAAYDELWGAQEGGLHGGGDEELLLCGPPIVTWGFILAPPQPLFVPPSRLVQDFKSSVASVAANGSAGVGRAASRHAPKKHTKSVGSINGPSFDMQGPSQRDQLAFSLGTRAGASAAAGIGGASPHVAGGSTSAGGTPLWRLTSTPTHGVGAAHARTPGTAAAGRSQTPNTSTAWAPTTVTVSGGSSNSGAGRSSGRPGRELTPAGRVLASRLGVGTGLGLGLGFGMGTSGSARDRSAPSASRVRKVTTTRYTRGDK